MAPRQDAVHVRRVHPAWSSEIVTSSAPQPTTRPDASRWLMVVEAHAAIVATPMIAIVKMLWFIFNTSLDDRTCSEQRAIESPSGCIAAKATPVIMTRGEMDQSSSGLNAKAFLGLAQLMIALGLLVFGPAGTWRYVQGWAFLLVFGVSSLAITVYLMRHDPKLLARRVKAGPAAEQRPRQRLIQALASGAFILVVAIPALDHRLGWSHVRAPLVVFGDALIAVGFLIVFLVFKENSYASALIEVGAAQKVIETGPYALVRHPMYAGALALPVGIPLGLGSFWGLLTLVPLTAILVSRLRDEETLLLRQLVWIPRVLPQDPLPADPFRLVSHPPRHSISADDAPRPAA